MTRTERNLTVAADPPPRRKLPIGIQTFHEIREDGGYYVDKTSFIRRLVEGGKHYFLSRPRRFGKSLLVDTIKELFEGNESLFRGLAVHDEWDWSVRRPVVRFDFSQGDYKQADYLHANVAAQLDRAERTAGVASRYPTAPERFGALIEALHERTGRRVTVLVDEYDKPILDALEKPATARANRDFLRGLYSTVKFADAHIAFSLFTGVSRFSRVSLFSGLNNLKDVTLDPRYSAICGYTEENLDTVFAPELTGLDRGEIRHWYNGYNWLGAEKVYNPFDILLLFDARKFRAWWFETGTPAFLLDTLVSRGVSAAGLDGMLSDDELLSAFDVDDIATEALLFQTGYLTIQGEVELGGRSFYRLGYPNREVRQSLNDSLLRRLQGSSSQVAHDIRLRKTLLANDFTGLASAFKALFAGIPYQWHTKNDIADYEGYYASVFYSCFAALGMEVTVEDSTSRGRLDMAVVFNDHVYLFEFKVVESPPDGAAASPTTALAQLRERGYADKYRASGRPIHLIGVEFSKETRNVAAFEAATA